MQIENAYRALIEVFLKKSEIKLGFLWLPESWSPMQPHKIATDLNLPCEQ
jgi:hypothetical protein